MPAFGTPTTETGITPLYNADPKEMDAHHRKLQRNRMLMPKEPAPITRQSIEGQVYIYNAGPFPFLQPMGSMGQFTIPHLAEDRVVLNTELNVAGPLIIPGLPKEPYPSEGMATILYHGPPENRGERSDNPGLDFAYEVIGKGQGVNASANLEPYGVFVSLQREQSKPEKGATAEAHAAHQRWVKDVKDAQAKLRALCADRCQRGNMEYSRGNFKDYRSDDLYIMARIIKATEMDFPWLKDTAENVDKKSCWSCGTVLKGFALKCLACGEMQVTQQEFDAEKERRSKLAL